MQLKSLLGLMMILLATPVMASWCYQETTNINSTTDGTCTLNYTGDYGVDNYYINMTYVKPHNVSSAIWEVMHGFPKATNHYNITIPDDCFTQSLLKLRIYSSGQDVKAQPQCLNSTAWMNVGHATSNPFTGGGYSSGNSSYAFDGNWTTSTVYWDTVGWVSYSSNTIANSTINEEAIWWNISDSCTYPGGNWIIQCNDNCLLNTNTNLNKNNITFTGAGTITITALINNFTLAYADSGCKVISKSGGKLG